MRLLSSWLILILFAGPSAFASAVLDPSEIGIGARPLGMGRAFTAVADDGSALFTNPAGLAQGVDFKVIAMSGSLMQEVPYSVFGGSFPFLNGNLGVGYSGLGISGIQETRLVNGTPEATGNKADYTNASINVSYASGIENVPLLNYLNPFFLKNTKVGASIKYVSQGFTGSSSFDAGNASGYDVDLGTVAKVTDDTKIGISAKNVLPGNNIKSDELPMIINLGIAKEFKEINLITALDVEFATEILLHVGGEWSPVQSLKLRAGFDQKPSAGSVTTDLSGGVGINIDGIAFDYAYHTFAGLSDLSSHFFSIGYALEAPAKEIEEPIERPVPSRPTPKPEIKAPLPKPKPKIAIEEKIIYHRIKWGDTLARISIKYYGDSMFYPEIAKMNKIEDPNIIIAGEELKIDLTLKKRLD